MKKVKSKNSISAIYISLSFYELKISAILVNQQVNVANFA